ncbi:hypothetical protein ZOSMA_123G00780 [Zostera marina]|uniref:Uncharacterized protein n=1 Tax=Zostera marina TaxID=29655 RepID=A0A0K9Q0Q1_ZOSMR|nr:hypothetical protein ZOSMA_123G00780 [Zostera marina]
MVELRTLGFYLLSKEINGVDQRCGRRMKRRLGPLTLQSANRCGRVDVWCERNLYSVVSPITNKYKYREISGTTLFARSFLTVPCLHRPILLHMSKFNLEHVKANVEQATLSKFNLENNTLFYFDRLEADGDLKIEDLRSVGAGSAELGNSRWVPRNPLQFRRTENWGTRDGFRGTHCSSGDCSSNSNCSPIGNRCSPPPTEITLPSTSTEITSLDNRSRF